jgi:3-hydroxyisobutyrate dehydrogenase-like beta-hydroxyacid dehydrogenase
MAHLDIAIVGTGRRIHRVAEQLRARGHKLAVHDPTHPGELGGGYLLPADAAAGADLLVLDLSEARVYDDSVYRDGGVCDALPSGAAVLDLSPQGPTAARVAGATLVKYQINYADGLLVNFLRERPGYEPTLVIGAGASDNPAYGCLSDALGARMVHIGNAGSANQVRLVLEDAYEMAIRFISESLGGGCPHELDDLRVDQETLTAALSIVGGRQVATRSRQDRLDVVAA